MAKSSPNLKILIFAVIAFIAVSAILYNTSFEEDIVPTTTTLQTTTTTSVIKENKGTLVVLFKDEEHKIPGGATVKTMNFKVTGMEALLNKSSGMEWVSLIDSKKSLDLLKYTDTLAKIAEKETESGRYEKIKIMFSEGNISITNSLLGIYRPKFYNLIVPEEKTFDYLFNVPEGEILTLTLDFDIENSVTRTADGYTFDPQVTFSEQAGHVTNVENI
jgi:hypothetical protein